MRVHLLAARADSELRSLLASEPLASSIAAVESHASVAALLGAAEADRWEIAIVEDSDAISALRAERDTLAIIGLGDDVDEPELLRSGADDFIPRSLLDAATLARALRHARERNELRNEEIELLRSVREFGESLVGDDDLDSIVGRVLERVMSRTGASIGYLVCQWSWKDRCDRVDALLGASLDEEAVRALAVHPLVSPLEVEPGRFSVDPDDLSDLADDFGPIRSLMIVPVARTAAWGRGGIVVAAARENAFGPRHARIAGGLAAWAGVAIMQAGIIGERNRAIEVRERVLAMASHDLRTPLSVFNMALELLADCDDPEERAEIVGRAERSIANMRRLIGDLLDYAAVDAGTLRIERTLSNPLRVARRAVEQMALAARRKSIEMALTGVDEEAVQRVELDGGRIEQLLMNLLDNAVKFTPRAGRIELTVTQSDAATEFTVVDSGPGIDAEIRRRLFDRFYSSAPSGKGFGLGLPIARGIARGHGGDLSVESAPGEGARFTLTIPHRRDNIESR